MADKRGRNAYPTREAYLNAGIAKMRELLKEAGHELPDKIRASIGFTGGGKTGTRRAEAWHADASEGGWYEIFIRPDICKEAEVLSLLLTVLITTIVPAGAGRGPRFRAIATSVGLSGSMRNPKPTPGLRERLNSIGEQLGPLEHSALNIGWRAVEPTPKQSTRMLKFQCPTCEFPVRFTESWFRKAGAPLCAACKIQFVAVERNEARQDVPKNDEKRDVKNGKAEQDVERSAEGALAAQFGLINTRAGLPEPALSPVSSGSINWIGRFSSRPSNEVLASLKAAGGHYDGVDQCWNGSSTDVISLRAVVEGNNGTFSSGEGSSEGSG